MLYQTRNLENIAKLGDHTKAAALKWYDYLVVNNIEVLIYETIRDIETQRANVKKGASQTMKSYHLVGQALDFVPVVNGTTDWNGYGRPDIKQAIAEAKRLGFEWGGEWETLVDKPHLQYNYKGYGTDTFTGQPTQVPAAEITQAAPAASAPVSNDLIRFGNKGDKVKGWQQDLIKAGEKLPRYGADGDFGKETEDATKAFQARYGLAVDGIVGPQSKAKMAEVLANAAQHIPYPGYYIKEGSRGAYVGMVQRKAGVKDDEIFGPKTKAAVITWQRAHGLSADGIVGPPTWSAMF